VFFSQTQAVMSTICLHFSAIFLFKYFQSFVSDENDENNEMKIEFYLWPFLAAKGLASVAATPPRGRLCRSLRA